MKNDNDLNMSSTPKEGDCTNCYNINEDRIRKMESSATGTSPTNRKIDKQGTTNFMDNSQFRQNLGRGCVDHEQIAPKDQRHGDAASRYNVPKDTANNFPDVVSCTSMSPQSQDSVEDCKDPDIVRSNSSSDEKSGDVQVSSKKTLLNPKFSGTFKHVDDDKQSRHSDLHPKKTNKISAAISNIFNGDSGLQSQGTVSTKPDESEDVFDESPQIGKQNLGDVTPVVDSESLPTTTTFGVSSSSSNCSDKGQKARDRFRSSGYFTGSAESSQGKSRSKASVHLSREGKNETQPQDLQSSTLNEKVSSSAVGELVIQWQPKPCGECFLENKACVYTTKEESVLSRETNTKGDFRLTYQEVNNSPAGSVQSQTAGNKQNQEAGQEKLSGDKKQLQAVKHQMSARESLQALLQANPNSKSILDQQQAHLSFNGRGNTGYAESLNHIWHSSLQNQVCPNGSFNYQPPQTSSCSGGSYFIPPSVEEKWHAEPSSASITRMMLLQSGPETSNISGESRYNLESLMKWDNRVIQAQALNTETAAQAQHSAPSQAMALVEELLSNNICWSELPSSMMMKMSSSDLMEKFQKSVRCHESTCDVPDCVQVKKDLAALRNESNYMWSLGETHKMMLLIMYYHQKDCDHPKCPFPWCGDHTENGGQQTVEECLLMMKKRVENFVDCCTLLETPVKYMQLTSTTTNNRMPVEGEDWTRLCMMGNSRRTLLAKPTKSHQPSPYSGSELWVLKKIPRTEGDDWGPYARLREMNHRSVVTLLWAASYDDHILVCSLHEGCSLLECLPCLPPAQLRFVSIFNIMLQLTSAVRHLHGLDIVYIYWMSKNILVTYHTSVNYNVKLSNFSCSVLLDHSDGDWPRYDGGHLLLALPRHIIPPELSEKVKVEFESDVWGLGCLLHELVTGHPIWHEYRHLLDRDFKSQIKNKLPIPTVYPELVKTFAACWKTDPSQRAQLHGLETLLIEAYQVTLNS